MAGRILIVDGDTANRSLLGARLSGAFYEVRAVAGAEAALAAAQADPPDLALLAEDCGGIGGVELCRLFKSDPALHAAPVVLLTRRASTEERLRGLEAGADDFLTRPVSDLELFARVRNLVRMKAMQDELRLRDETSLSLEAPPDPDAAPPPVVALLCADPEHARARAALLTAETGIRTVLPSTERELLRDWPGEHGPDALVLERDLGPGRDGLRLIPELRARPGARSAAILLLVRRDDLEGAAAGLDLGANDYLSMPCDQNELVARLASQLRRKRISDRLRDTLRSGLAMAITDPLTGLYNRRYAESHLQRLTEQSAASGAPMTVMLLDLDRFKEVNDRHGHAAGDEVLVEFSRRVRENLRNVDLVARIGGEEFLVAMPETDEDGALRAAERIRRAVESRPFPISAPPGALSVTVSAGVVVADAAARARRWRAEDAAEAVPGLAEAPAARISATAGGAAAQGAAEAMPDGAPAPGATGARISGAAPLSGELRPTSDAFQPRMLLEDADRALYASKHSGRNRVTTICAA